MRNAEPVAMASGLRTPLGKNSIHLCVDMQKLYLPGGPWPNPWMERVLPAVAAISERYADRTIFTRMIPPQSAEEMPGKWQEFYSKWPEATRRQLQPDCLDLVPPLQDFVPPALVVDKTRYSAFALSSLSGHLENRRTDALVITGAETDMCVLATVLGAIDRGYPVVVITDAVCSYSDEGHESLLALYRQRFSVQIETTTLETLLDHWR